MKRAQTSIEYLLVAVVLVSLAFYAFSLILRESEINTALSSAREACLVYALQTGNQLKALNYTIHNNQVTLKPVFSKEVNSAELTKRIIRAIFCTLDQNVEPKNCTRNYQPPSNSVKFIMNYSVEV